MPDITVEATVNTPGWCIDVSVGESFAYIADQDQGCTVVDISIPTSPTLVTTFSPETDRVAGTALLDEEHVAVGYGFEGLKVYNVSDSQNITETFSFTG